MTFKAVFYHKILTGEGTGKAEQQASIVMSMRLQIVVSVARMLFMAVPRERRSHMSLSFISPASFSI